MGSLYVLYSLTNSGRKGDEKQTKKKTAKD